MPATPARIALSLNDGVVLSRSDPTIKANHPNADDQGTVEIEMFFDNVADAQALLDERWNLKSVAGRVHEQVEIDSSFGLGTTVSITPAAPQIALTDEPRGIVNAGCVISGYATDYGSERYAIECMGIGAYIPPPPPTEDDEMTTFSIAAAAAQNEGNSGTTTFVFVVTRTGGLTFAAAVDWAVTGSGGNPANTADFVGGVLPSGTLNFAAGQSTANISIPVQGDTTVEPDEGFTVTLTNPRTIGALSTAAASSSILNDDAFPTTGYDIILLVSDSYGVGTTARAGGDTDWPNSYQFHSYGGDAAYRTIDSDTTPYSQQIGYDLVNSWLSPAEYLAKAYAARTGRKCLVVPMGVNGSRLVGGGAWSVGESFHEASVAQANAAVTAALAAYPSSQFVGIFQWLGANDMAAGTTRSAFASALTAAIADYRSRITGASSSWYVMGGILPDYLAITAHQAVEFALQDVHRAGTNVMYIPMPTGYNSGDNLHPSNAGNRYFGGAIDAVLADAVAPVINVPASISAYEATNFQYILYQNQISFGGADKYASWSLSGTDAASFEIVEISPTYTSGDLHNAYYKVVLRYVGDAVLPAYATKSSYSFTLNAKSSHGILASKAITLNILHAYGSVSGGAVTATHMSSQDLSSYDLNALPAMAFGAGLNLIYVYAGGNDPTAFTSLTVNGVHATLVNRATSGDCQQVWAVPIATAGNYSPIIVPAGTFAGTPTIEVVCLTNTVASPASTSTTRGASLTCPTGGIIIGQGISGGLTAAASGCTLLSGPNGVDGNYAVSRSSTGAIDVTASSFASMLSEAWAKA